MRLIIDIPELDYECAKRRWMRGNDAHKMDYYISKGIPLDSNSERAEVQAYFAGEAYGWEEGRKALLDDVKADIAEKYANTHHMYPNYASGLSYAYAIIDKHTSKAESEE